MGKRVEFKGRRDRRLIRVPNPESREVPPDKVFVCPVCEKVRNRWAAHKKWCQVCEGKLAHVDEESRRHDRIVFEERRQRFLRAKSRQPRNRRSK